MTPLELIFILFFTQIIIYLLLDKFDANKWKLIVFGLLIIGYVFIIPGYFFPENPNNEPRCGVPVIGVTLAFWILGCGTVVITHLAYLFIKKIIGRQQKYNT